MTFELLGNLSKEERALLPALISFSVGNPTADRLKSILDSYEHENSRVLLVAKIDNALVGCIGLQKQENLSLTILHIAVLDKYRKKGIGRSMINEIIRQLKPKELIAETDNDAVDFYRRLDFEVYESFQSEWQVKRFRVRRIK